MILLNLGGPTTQSVLPPDEQAALGARGQRRTIEVTMAPLQQSLVAMNPPFTKPTKHAPFGSADNVEPRNPAFAAFGTTVEEQEEMKKLERRLGKNTISDGNAGLGTTFTAIANNMVASNGRIALILPTSAMMGGSYDPSKNQAYSWQGLRNLLYNHYREIVVVSIAQPDKKSSAFSADSDYADCMVIATRIPPGEHPSRRAHFVNLKARPTTKLEAQETARAIRQAVAKTTATGTYNRITIGNDDIGFVTCESTEPNRKWTSLRIHNASLMERARKLVTGQLQLPQRAEAIDISITRVGNITQVGPLHRDITGRPTSPFVKRDGGAGNSEYPMLWNHPKKANGGEETEPLQNRMLTEPDSHGEVKRVQAKDNENKEGRAKRETANLKYEKEAAEMWKRHATHLHINADFQFNANPTAALFTERTTLGGRSWPTLRGPSEEHEKALCVWLNSTPGLISYWLVSNRNQDGRGGITVTGIPDMPVLDTTRLSPNQLQAAVRIFDDLRTEVLKPANEAWDDDVRKKLDRRLLTEVLNQDDNAVEQMNILRQEWCSEPTVTSTKGTGPPR